MVSYGNEEFKEWAENLGFNDSDLAIIKSKLTKRKYLWLLLYLIVCCGGVIESTVSSLPATTQSIIMSVYYIVFLFIYFSLPFFVECSMLLKIIKTGSFNAKPGIITSLLTLVMYISFVSIFPIILWRGAKKKWWGTGINGLIKKGVIGNH